MIQLIQRGRNFSITTNGETFKKVVADKNQQQEIKDLVKEYNTANAVKQKSLFKKISSFFGIKENVTKKIEKVKAKAEKRNNKINEETLSVELLLKSILNKQKELKNNLLQMQKDIDNLKQKEVQKPINTVDKKSSER